MRLVVSIAADRELRLKAEPQMDVPYWVQCEKYRTMARFAPDHKWHTLIQDAEITDPVLDFFLP
ncbi:MAG: hypothetical protein QM813_18610 [Verrucomicrobiota bacterium]